MDSPLLKTTYVRDGEAFNLRWRELLVQERARQCSMACFGAGGVTSPSPGHPGDSD